MSISEKWRAIAGLPNSKLQNAPAAKLVNSNLFESFEQLLEAMKTAKVSVTQATPKELPGITSDVFGIKNESPVIAELISLLGIPDDGTPYKIRTGFMSYDTKTKMLFFSKFKYDLPGFVGKRPTK